MDLKKVSLYTYLTFFGAMLLWVCTLASVDISSTRFLPLLLVTTGCMLIISEGLTKIRKAVGLDIKEPD